MKNLMIASFNAAPATACRRRQLIVSVLAFVCASAAVVSAAPAPPLVPARQILFHKVEKPDHTWLGAVTDLLLEMPSGRVAFVAVKPSDLFRRPRALPPSAIAMGPKGELQLKATLADWYDAPIITWNGQQIHQLTEDGVSRIRGYADQAWERRPSPERGMVRPAVGAVHYASMRGLMNARVLDPQRQQVGFIGDFLVDWQHYRAMYGIVSPELPPLGGVAMTRGFAIPTALLLPPRGQEVIVANVSPAIANAPYLTAETANRPGSATQVFRYQAGSAVVDTGSRSASSRASGP